jgi:hypothetical protein
MVVVGYVFPLLRPHRPARPRDRLERSRQLDPGAGFGRALADAPHGLEHARRNWGALCGNRTASGAGNRRVGHCLAGRDAEPRRGSGERDPLRAGRSQVRSPSSSCAKAPFSSCCSF